MGDQQERQLKLKGEIRQRLASICSNLSEPDFQDLIEKIAANYVKADARMLRFGPMRKPERPLK